MGVVIVLVVEDVVGGDYYFGGEWFECGLDYVMLVCDYELVL